MMSINLAIHDKDPRRMADAAERLLSLGWPGFDDKVRRDVKEQVKALEKPSATTAGPTRPTPSWPAWPTPKPATSTSS